MEQKFTEKTAIAIDGPSGAGKSTAAKIVAKKLGILYVDTGALYRTIGLFVKRRGVDPHESGAVVALLPEIDIKVRYENGTQAVYLNGENPGEAIREPDISMYASTVSAIPEVRAFLLETQKGIARENSVVMDGRDIGTVILPDADLKVFLVASDETRAQRRCEELRAKGIETTVEEVLRDMRERDANDRGRQVAPAIPAADAIELDNSALDAEGTADAIIELLYKKKQNSGQKKAKKCSYGPFYKVIHFLFAAPIRFFRRLHVHGKENEPTADKGAYLLCANHLTWRDPILLCACTHRQHPHFMAKKELFKIPLLRGLIRALGAYPVERGAMDVGAIKRTIRMLEEGTCVGMFPQGHRYKGQEPRSTPVKNGVALVAARSHVPILPVAFKCKDFKPRLFRRVDVYIGKPITWEELRLHGGDEKDYARMTEYIFGRVCDLAEGKE